MSGKFVGLKEAENLYYNFIDNCFETTSQRQDFVTTSSHKRHEIRELSLQRWVKNYSKKKVMK